MLTQEEQEHLQREVHFKIPGLVDIKWEQKKVFLTPEYFFRIFPGNTVGLVTQVDGDCYKASINRFGIEFYAYYYEHDRQRFLKNCGVSGCVT